MGVNTITIRQLLQRITDGEVRVPAFQRDFVWEPDRVQFLMDAGHARLGGRGEPRPPDEPLTYAEMGALVRWIEGGAQR